MTAEELALLGYQPGQTSSQDINLAQAAVTPQDLQQLYAMSGNPNIGTPDPASLNQLPPSVDMATLNAVAQLPASDPNGLTTDQPNLVSGPDGRPMPLPPSTGAANLAGGQPAPEQPAQQTPPPSQLDQSQAPKLTPWQQYLSERGIGPNSVVDMASHRELLKGFNALQLKQLEMNDPEKKVKIQKDQVELQKQTMEQSDAMAKKVDAIPNVEHNIKLLDDLLADKGLPDAVGAKGAAFLWGMKSEPVAGTAAADFMERVKQVQGKNFLEAFNQLRGAGQISEVEGKKAQEALGRLGTGQTEESFKNSVQELRGILQTGLDRSKERLAAQGQKVPASTLENAPASGSGSSSGPATRPAVLNLKGVMYQLGADGTYHRVR